MYEWLDWLIIWQTFCLLLFASTLAFFGEKVMPWLRNHDHYIDLSAILYCSSLSAWMSLGGSRSRIWDWMPPFCLFGRAVWLRWLVAGAIVAGTVLGIIESHSKTL